MELIVIGHVDVELEEKRVKVVNKCKFYRKKNSLYIEGIGNNVSITVTKNGTVFQSCGNVYGGVGNVCVQSISGTDGCVVFGGNGFNVSMVGNVVVNGKQIVGNKVVNVVNGNQIVGTDEDEITYIDLEENEIFNSIVLKGSGNINISEHSKVDSFCSLTLQGSGDIDVTNRMFSSSNITLSGSGDIRGDNVKIDNLNATLMGSGDISGFQCTNGNLSLMGSGDIKISSTQPHSVRKSKMGSGSIKVKQA